jgi:hypothetical protein
MRVSLKNVVITGEVTVLLAFTGVGVHLFLQPHRSAQAPPPLHLPVRQSAGAASLPSVTPRLLPPPSTAPSPRTSGPAELTPSWIAQLNRDDRTQMQVQWDIVQRLTRAIEQFLAQRVVPAMEGKR